MKKWETSSNETIFYFERIFHILPVQETLSLAKIDPIPQIQIGRVVSGPGLQLPDWQWVQFKKISITTSPWLSITE